MENSPLSKLPPELRNRIYELALDFSCNIVIRTLQQHSKIEVKGSLGYYHPIPSLGLLTSCKVIDQECGQLFYASNHLVFAGFDALREFKRCVGTENVAALRSVVIEATLSWIPDLAKEKDIDLFFVHIWWTWVEAQAHPACRFRGTIQCRYRGVRRKAIQCIDKCIDFVFDARKLRDSFAEARAAIEDAKVEGGRQAGCLFDVIGSVTERLEYTTGVAGLRKAANGEELRDEALA